MGKERNNSNPAIRRPTKVVAGASTVHVGDWSRPKVGLDDVCRNIGATKAVLMFHYLMTKNIIESEKLSYYDLWQTIFNIKKV